jgi:hypothetical protein
MEQWCSGCEVLIVRGLGSSMSSSPPIKFTIPLERSGLILLSSGISYQVANEVYSCAFRFISFSSYSPPKKATKFFYSFRPTTHAQPFAQFSFGVRSFEFLFGCWFRLVLVHVCFFHPLSSTKKNQSTKKISSTDPPIRIRFSFHRHKNLIRRVLLKMGITFRSELRLR